MKKIIKSLSSELDSCVSLDDVKDIKSKYLGKRGLISLELKKIGKLPPQERKVFAIKIQDANTEAEKLIREVESLLKSKHSQRKEIEESETLGYHKPKIGHLHPLTETAMYINDYFKHQGYSLVDGPHLETDEYNSERLNLPKNHPARDLQDSIYIKAPTYLLRSQTSSVEARILSTHEPPMRFVCEGRTYRNEKVNASNHFLFHQYQGVVVDKNITLKDLLSTLDGMFKYVYGDDVVMRYRYKYYPEVMIGVGPDMQCFGCKGHGCKICKRRGWIETGGAGILHPQVLEYAGIDNKAWGGFAFGLGLDRLAMARHSISDIRDLFNGDITYKHY
jgi:phenylalanyl-tRNA synthetase alpha chain